MFVKKSCTIVLFDGKFLTINSLVGKFSVLELFHEFGVYRDSSKLLENWYRARFIIECKECKVQIVSSYLALEYCPSIRMPGNFVS